MSSDTRLPAPYSRRYWLIVLPLIAAAVIVPFLAFGAQLEAAALNALQFAADNPLLIAALVVALLVADVALPVPSSIVGTFAGATLGIAGGALAVWVGMMLGCVVGYGAGRLIAPPPGARGGAAEHRAPNRAGLVMLAATRAIPVLAETGIVAAGAARTGFGRALLVTAPANLLVALAYAGVGKLLVSIDPMLAAILATLIPSAAFGLWLLMRRRPRATVGGV